MNTRHVSLFAFVGCLLACQAIARAGYTIRISGGSERARGSVMQIGPWRMRHPTLKRAVQVFGAPSSKRAVRPGFAGTTVADCGVAWKRIGLRAVFTTLGLNPGTCNPAKQVDIATIVGRKWRTWNGLRVGDPVGRIRIVEPQAKYRHGTWVLATKYWPFGGSAPTRLPSVWATIGSGRIATFVLDIAAQGE